MIQTMPHQQQQPFAAQSQDTFLRQLDICSQTPYEIISMTTVKVMYRKMYNRSINQQQNKQSTNQL